MESTSTGNSKKDDLNGSGFRKFEEEAEGIFSDVANSFKLSDETKARLNGAVNTSSDFVRKYPLSTVVGVAAAGLILGYLLRGGSRSQQD